MNVNLQDVDAILKPFYSVMDDADIKDEFWDDDPCRVLGEGLDDELGGGCSPLAESNNCWGPVEGFVNNFLLDANDSNLCQDDAVDSFDCGSGIDADRTRFCESLLGSVPIGHGCDMGTVQSTPSDDDIVFTFGLPSLDDDDRKEDFCGSEMHDGAPGSDLVFSDRLVSDATLGAMVLQSSATVSPVTMTPTATSSSGLSLCSTSKPSATFVLSSSGRSTLVNNATATCGDVTISAVTNSGTQCGTPQQRQPIHASVNGGRDTIISVTSSGPATVTHSTPNVIRFPIKQEHSYSLLLSSQTSGSTNAVRGERIFFRRTTDSKKIESSDGTVTTCTPVIPSSVRLIGNRIVATRNVSSTASSRPLPMLQAVTTSPGIVGSATSSASVVGTTAGGATLTFTTTEVKTEPLDADELPQGMATVSSSSVCPASVTLSPARLRITTASQGTANRAVGNRVINASVAGSQRVCRLSTVDDGDDLERRLVPIVLHKDKDFGHAGLQRLRIGTSTNGVQRGSQTVVLTTTGNSSSVLTSSYAANSQGVVLSQPLNVKVEPSGYSLPPSPPSSNSSDSEGSLSPLHHLPASPASGNGGTTTVSSTGTSTSTSVGTCNAVVTKNLLGALVARTVTSSPSTTSVSTGSFNGRPTFHRVLKPTMCMGRQPIQTNLISHQSGGSGILALTEEEKRTLIAEGYPVPTRLPLSKSEEKSLKKIRRKIKNKISAQESRRKKKEYMDTLEKKVELLESENSQYQEHIQSLETANSTLLAKMHSLQLLIDQLGGKRNAEDDDSSDVSSAKFPRRSFSTQTIEAAAEKRRVMSVLRRQSGVANNCSSMDVEVL